jgi:5'-nucleotidase
VVAPETEQSGAGHSLTLHHPLRIRKLTGRRYAVSGTPTDCVLLAVNELMKDHRPDLVLSGINRGGNIGEDVTYSGTVAAAMEGTLLNLRAIAISLVVEDGGEPRWDTARHWVPEVLRRLGPMSWPSDVLLNVNIPHLPTEEVTGLQLCVQGRRKIGSELAMRSDPRGRTYYWIGPQREEDRYRRGTDLWAVSHGAVAVTPLCMDMTHRPTLTALKQVLA